MNNPVSNWQMVVKEPEKAAAFYQKLFGWKIAAANALGYREVQSEAGGIAGGIWPAPPEAQNLVQLFVSVDDLDKAAADAVRLGGTIIVPPSVLPGGDAMAVVLDPAGLTFGLMRRRETSSAKAS